MKAEDIESQEQARIGEDLRNKLKAHFEAHPEAKELGDVLLGAISTLEFYANPKRWQKKVDGYMGFTDFDPSDVENDHGRRATAFFERSR